MPFSLGDMMWRVSGRVILMLTLMLVSWQTQMDTSFKRLVTCAATVSLGSLEKDEPPDSGSAAFPLSTNLYGGPAHA